VKAIVETGINTASSLLYRLLKEKHRALRVLWSKPARIVPKMKIDLFPSIKEDPSVRVPMGKGGGRNRYAGWLILPPDFVVEEYRSLTLPKKPPPNGEIIGIGQVEVIFHRKRKDILKEVEKWHSQLEVCYSVNCNNTLGITYYFSNKFKFE
jgi:hypothetical protein